MFDRSINIVSLLSSLALSWFRDLLGLSKKKKFKLGEEIFPQLGEVRSLLLFGYMGMGDAIMFEPTLRAYLHRFPNTNFDVIVGSGSQSLAILANTLKENGRTFRSIITADFKTLTRKERKKMNAKLRANCYDACLAMYTTPVQYFLQTIESIPIRIGHVIRAQAWYKPRPNYLFNLARRVSQDIDEREPYRHFRLAQTIGIQLQGTEPLPQMTIPENIREWAVTFLEQNGLTNKELIAVHLGVSRAMSWKKWPDVKYAEVFRQLALPSRHFLFFGSEEESEEIEIARKSVKEQSTVFAGTLEIMEVGALLSCCRAMVGNDSGIGHLSAALSVPTFRIFGPSDHFGCEPYSQAHVTLYKDLTCSPCMNLGLIKPGYSVLNCGHRNCLRLITVEEVQVSLSRYLLNPPPDLISKKN
jgi:heptosyltransferase-2